MEPEIEVSPAMIAAGISAFSYHDGIRLDDLVITIYRAMEAVKAPLGDLGRVPSE